MTYKTFFSSAISSIVLTLTAVAGVDLGSAAHGTPYDSYMQPVKRVLGNLEGAPSSMERVQALMKEGRSFRYSYTEPYVAKLPQQTAASRAGDCKAKALWLCDQLGDENVRFVVGKSHYGVKLSHAWVLWREASSGKWFILDCTNNYRPIAADSVRQDDYIPLYSWGKNGTYRHAATTIGLAAVAGKRATPGVAAADLAAN